MKSEPASGIRAGITGLYYGQSARARQFRFGLIAVDVVTIVFFIVSSMMELTSSICWADLAIAVLLLIDYGARMAIANRPSRFALHFGSITDAIVIASLLAPLVIDNLAFLRVVRMLRLVRSHHVLADLRGIRPWFRRNVDVVVSAVNLAVFVFVVTAIV